MSVASEVNRFETRLPPSAGRPPAASVPTGTPASKEADGGCSPRVPASAAGRRRRPPAPRRSASRRARACTALTSASGRVARREVAAGSERAVERASAVRRASAGAPRRSTLRCVGASTAATAAHRAATRAPGRVTDLPGSRRAAPAAPGCASGRGRLERRAVRRPARSRAGREAAGQVDEVAEQGVGGVAVGERVVHLRDDGHPVVVERLADVHLPQRDRAVQRRARDPPDQLLEPLHAARLRAPGGRRRAAPGRSPVGDPERVARGGTAPAAPVDGTAAAAPSRSITSPVNRPRSKAAPRARTSAILSVCMCIAGVSM